MRQRGSEAVSKRTLYRKGRKGCAKDAKGISRTAAILLPVKLWCLRRKVFLRASRAQRAIEIMRRKARCHIDRTAAFAYLCAPFASFALKRFLFFASPSHRLCGEPNP
jgi:hypothetical protein